MSRTFTPTQIAHYGHLVRNTVDELLTDVPASGDLDIVQAFTNKLPIQAVAELLGLPRDRRDWFLLTSREIGAILEPMSTFDPELMSTRYAEPRPDPKAISFGLRGPLSLNITSTATTCRGSVSP